jgi:hypothetical protein
MQIDQHQLRHLAALNRLTRFLDDQPLHGV